MSKLGFQKFKKIHMIGIGGSGMIGIATILQKTGFKITGSDLVISDELKELKELSSGEDDSQLADFYDLQLKRGVKASIAIAIQEVDSLSKQIPKVEVTFNGALTKDQFKKFLELGWKIDRGTFKYVCNQEDIFDFHSKIAELISVTIKSVNQYKWTTS